MVQIKDLTLVVSTEMLSQGYQYKEGESKKSEKEFRIQELIGGMRYWWRSSHIFINGEAMYEAESKLFGSTSQRSPIAIHEHYTTDIKKLVNRKMPGGTKIPIKIRFDETVDIKKYIGIMELSSILGGLGRSTRRGYGSFYIEGDIPIYSKEELLKKITALLWIDPENSIMERLTDSESALVEKADIKNNKIGQYPYIKKIMIGDSVELKTFRNSIDNIRPDSKYNFLKEETKCKEEVQSPKKAKRFAKPIHISAYPAETKERVYPIITFLNNTSLQNDEQIQEYEKYEKVFEKIVTLGG